MCGASLNLIQHITEYHFTFHQTLGDSFTFQQDNNLKQKAKNILTLLTKKTVNVTEWPSCSFNLNLLWRTTGQPPGGDTLSLVTDRVYITRRWLPLLDVPGLDGLSGQD